MNSIWEVIRQFTELGEVLLFLFLFTDAKVTKKNANRIYILLCVFVICLLRLILWPGIDDERIVWYEVLDFIIIWLIIEARAGRKIVLYLFSYFYCGVVNMIVLWFVSRKMGTIPIELLEEGEVRSLVYISICTVMVILKLVWVWFVRELKVNLSIKTYAIFVTLLIPIIYNAGQIFYIESEEYIDTNELFLEVKLFFVAVIFFGSSLGFVILINERKTHREKIVLQNELIVLQRQYYTELKEKQNELREIRHDMNAHLLQITHLYRSGNLKDLEEYIEQLEERWDYHSYNVIETGSSIADVILNYYRNMAFKECVNIEFQGKFPEKLQIEEYDLCALLFNAISNAYEECKKIHSGGKVNINIKYYKNILVITIRNNYISKIKNIYKLKSSKLNKNNHGYGVKIIKKIVDKYDGTMNYKIYGEWLYLQINLPVVV